MGAPKFNLNAAKNGYQVARLVVGELPKQLNHVKIEGRRYRSAMEECVLAVHGEVSVTDCHAIDTATAATVHAGICRWLLRQKISTMQTADILACSRELLKAKKTRDRAVKTLRLDAGRQTILDALYSEVPDDDPTRPTTASVGAKEGTEGSNIPPKAKGPPRPKPINQKGRKT